MHRKIISLVLACIGLVSIASGEENRPNVLLILVDDLKPALGCYGDTTAITPNIDRLASRGMRFEMAYCNQAVCAPSRFTLMLGSHSTSTGLYGLGSHLRQAIPDAVTMPQHFARFGGYRTESLGKVFHIGHGNEGDPDSFQVPHFKDKVIEYLDPSSTHGRQLTREEALFTNQKLGQIRSLPRGWAYESPQADDTAYADGRVAEETIRRLVSARRRRDSDGTPFFITAGFVRPHLPFSAPKRYWDMYDPSRLPMPEFEDLPSGAPQVAGKRGGEIAAYEPVPTGGEFPQDLKQALVHGYYASTSFVDAQIGKVLDALDRLNLTGNTIVVLWGDHGFHLGDLGIWTKHTNYEQANRIPIIIAAPGTTIPGSATGQPAESVDIFPTLAELAGLPEPAGPQTIDGLSLVPVLKDPTHRVRDHAYHAYPRSKLGRAIRTDRYRLVEWLGQDEDISKAEYELYDYSSDNFERTNIAGQKPEIVNQLKEILKKYPEPSGRKKTTPAQSIPTPDIENKIIRIKASVEIPQDRPHGVVMAQGGREHGYGLHFINGTPALDVRVNGVVTRLSGIPSASSGRIRLEATISDRILELVVNGRKSSRPSPGLIPTQPKDELSIGYDDRTAAGDYPEGNQFNGVVLEPSVITEVPHDIGVAQKRRPNIISVFIDDMGWSDLSCFGGKVRTQHIDQLAAEGLRFTQFYVNSPICSPSRVALTTGQYPHRWRITSYLNNRKNNIERGMEQWLDPNAPTLARELQKAGYATGHFGKWHMGGQRDVNEAPPISEYGFDASLTNFEGMGAKLLPLTLRPGQDPGKPGRIWERAEILGEPVIWMQRSEITGGFVSAALEFIREAEISDRPFFVNVWPDDVHSPFFPDVSNWGDGEKRTLYRSVLDEMDEQLAVLFDAVRTSERLRDNTLIVLCSDNGHETGAGQSDPLRGAKTWLYEGGIRSPLIVWGPGLIDSDLAGSVNNESVFCAMDLNRSLYRIAGIQPAAILDGEDVSATILGVSRQGRKSPIFFRRPPDRPGFGHGLQEDNPDLAIRSGKWKYLVNYDGSTPQLYDISKDPSESDNVFNSHPEIAGNLHNQLTDWNASMPKDAGDPDFRP